MQQMKKFQECMKKNEVYLIPFSTKLLVLKLLDLGCVFFWIITFSHKRNLKKKVLRLVQKTYPQNNFPARFRPCKIRFSRFQDILMFVCRTMSLEASFLSVQSISCTHSWYGGSIWIQKYSNAKQWTLEILINPILRNKLGKKIRECQFVFEIFRLLNNTTLYHTVYNSRNLW